MSELTNHDDTVDEVLDAAARAVSDQDDGAMTEHPNSEVLVGYQERRLTETAARRVRWHLAVCEECARDVLALEGFDLDEVAPELLPSPSETAEQWETFQQKLAQESPEPSIADGKPRREPASETESVTKRIPSLLALAASIVLALGLGYLVSRAPAGGPSNPFLADLLPDGSKPIRDASGDRDITVPNGMDSLILRLNLGDQTPYDSYRVEILDAAGEILWQQEDLLRQPAGQFIVWVKRAKVPAGSYELRLFGIGGDGTETLATYSFQLRDASE